MDSNPTVLHLNFALCFVLFSLFFNIISWLLFPFSQNSFPLSVTVVLHSDRSPRIDPASMNDLNRPYCVVVCCNDIQHDIRISPKYHKQRT